MKKQWKVRRVIVGEFVIVDVLDTKEEALNLVDESYCKGIWDSIDMWEI